jgi:hypothetical protein
MRYIEDNADREKDMSMRGNPGPVRGIFLCLKRVILGMGIVSILILSQ